MPRKRLALYVHLIWRTWDSEPLITSDIERPLYRVIQGEARKAGCTVLALNGSIDHIHLLVSLPTTVSIGDLMQQVKGVSSRLLNEILDDNSSFKWQGGYGAFSVSRWDVSKISEYVKRQKEHHATADLWAELERAVAFTSPGA